MISYIKPYNYLKYLRPYNCVKSCNIRLEYLKLYKCLVRFHGISTIVGYLIPNPIDTYISNIYVICFVVNVLKRA